MTIDQAIKNIEQVLAVFKGTLQEHQALQASLNLIKKKIADEKKPKVEQVENAEL